MFKHAAVALDLSDASDVIVTCLKHFKSFGTEKLTLITVISQSYPGGASTLDISDYERKLESYQKQAQSQGFKTQIRLEAGINTYPPVEVLRAARDAGADWLILANRGYNKLRELLLGSTASEILQRSTIPVFLLNIDVTGEDEFEDRKLFCVQSCRDMLKHIMHPTDFSSTAIRALRLGGPLLAPKANRWSLLHVQAASRVDLRDEEKLRQYDCEDNRRLSELEQELKNLGAGSIRLSIRYGAPAQEILKETNEQNAGMLLMGSQGRGFIQQLFFGGVSLQVARLSRVPILFIPAERD